MRCPPNHLGNLIALPHQMKKPDYKTELQEALLHIRAVQGSVPTHRRESKRVYSFSNRSFSDQLMIWDDLWRNTNDFWVRLHAFFFLERHLKKENELLEMWPVIVSWQDRVDDWGLCDALAKIYTKILVAAPGQVYPQLQQWNRDENLWKRRQSVVSLLYYSRTKKQHLSFNDIEQLISPLLSDKEYYVQKGVGWALRELRNVYPPETLTWLKTHIKQISPIAFTITIEKLDTASVNELKRIRKG
jgi:3-methyladenine DNA glycosylase AlkD